MARPARQTTIPSRDGVSASCVALPSTGAHSPWPRMADFLAERLPAVTRQEWIQRMARGEVLDEQGHPVPPDATYAGGQRLYYWRHLPDEPRVPFEARIVYQDQHLLVADKPHFLPVIPTGRFVRETLLVRLKQATGIESLSPVHRIDRETAGLVLFSTRAQDRGAYQAMFRERQVDKLYEAIAPSTGAWAGSRTHRSRIVEDPQAFYRMIETEGEPNSHTRIDRTEQFHDWARYRLEPVTGKRHQLRVHMNALSLPICGDQFYPVVRRGPGEPEDYADPLRLLARAIAFTDPVTGERREFESGLSLDWPDT
ncbi:pseudouridine synthase [Hydrogenophaga bisanensis]|uniref:Pseudouridine synthase n=1 Tax=Hydrogenophaga bisanensis TaxID=439611 RepID=A0ABW2R4F9_9BURK